MIRWRNQWTYLLLVMVTVLAGCNSSSSSSLFQAVGAQTICVWQISKDFTKPRMQQPIICKGKDDIQLAWNIDARQAYKEKLSPLFQVPPPLDIEVSVEEATAEYKGLVFLTFDDGPGKDTAQLLDLLAEEKIPATFFVLGEQAEKYPELLKRMVDEGHSIGNHSYNHIYKELYGSFASFSEQILKTSEAIYNITGEHSSLYRSPGGSYNNLDLSFYNALVEAGYQLYDWNVDSGDSRGRHIPSEEIIENIKQSQLSERAIVLLHDSNTHEATIAAMPEIIAYYREQNYQFAKITTDILPMVSTITETSKWNRKRATKEEQQRFAADVIALQKQ